MNRTEIFKFVEEVTFLTFDFSNEVTLDTGETYSATPAIECLDLTTETPVDSIALITNSGTATIADSIIALHFDGGTVGHTYKVQVTATTTEGRKVTIQKFVMIKE